MRPGPRRLDAGRPETLVAQVALERDDPLEEGGRVAELAARGMRWTQVDRCDDLDRAIADGSRDAQSFLPESDCFVVATVGHALIHHEVDDPPEPVIVTQRPGEPLGLAQVFLHARPFAER